MTHLEDFFFNFCNIKIISFPNCFAYLAFSYYNIQPYHAVPVAVNLVSNTILQASLSNKSAFVMLI
jgi:hypothetical protein